MDVFNDFMPDNDAPLLISFSNHLAECGYSTKIEFDFWDLYAYKEEDEPEISVLTVKNNLTAAQINLIAADDTPLKVVLAESLRTYWPRFDSIRSFLAFLGVGLYVRNVGWAILPGNPRIEVPDDFAFRQLERYSQDEAGNWQKTCTKCERTLPVDEFYDRPQRTAFDPKRNLCKRCHRGVEW